MTARVVPEGRICLGLGVGSRPGAGVAGGGARMSRRVIVGSSGAAGLALALECAGAARLLVEVLR